MPQLDKLSIINQITWLVIIFFSLYFIVIRTVLPVVYRNLRIRTLIIEEANEETKDSALEVSTLTANIEMDKIKILKETNLILTHFEQKLKNKYNNFEEVNQLVTVIKENNNEVNVNELKEKLNFLIK